jgi:hypothetical protein
MVRKVRVEKTRSVIVYVELWNASGVLLDIGQARKDANYSLFLASSTFAAFSFEAFLNHIGAKIFRTWDQLERSLSYAAKLALICEHLKVELDWGCEPWQTIKRLFSRRNDVAHGKNVELAIDKLLPPDGSFEQLLHEGLYTDWELLGRESAPTDFRSKLETAMRTIHSAANIKGDVLFQRGAGNGSASLVEVLQVPDPRKRATFSLS